MGTNLQGWPLDLGYQAEVQADVRPVADEVDPQAKSPGDTSAGVVDQGPGWWFCGHSCGPKRLRAQETRQLSPTRVPTALSGAMPRLERLCPCPAMYRDSGSGHCKEKITWRCINSSVYSLDNKPQLLLQSKQQHLTAPNAAIFCLCLSLGLESL